MEISGRQVLEVGKNQRVLIGDGVSFGEVMKIFAN